jgi:SAM-dependent methyltransferase
MRSGGLEAYNSFHEDIKEWELFSPKTLRWVQTKFLQDMPAFGGKLLDVGCGRGDFLAMAKTKGYSVTGIDFSTQIIETARKKFALKVYPLTLEEFVAKKPTEMHDIVTFWEVLEHLDNLQSFIKCLKKVLSSRGYVVCSVPNRERWRFQFLFEEWWDLPPIHLTRWNKRAIRRFFERNSFSVISIKIGPLNITDNAWNSFIMDKLGIRQLGSKFFRKGLGANRKKGSKIQGAIIKFVLRFYSKVFAPFFGVITLPLRLLLRKEGSHIYLIARRSEQRLTVSREDGKCLIN